MRHNTLSDPLQLANGAIIKNRIAKAAMEENMAEAEHAPGPKLCRLYQRWAQGGAGLIITGNVMVDSRALTGPGAVVLENDRCLAQFSAWASAIRSGGAQAWIQLNHPGRQLYASLGQQALGPSAVPVDIPGFSSMFSQPKAMNEKDISEVIDRFVNAAILAERAGFTGVEIHAAHGYLLSQFLSPLTNHRADHWGGSLQNRARLLLIIVQKVREVVKPEFCVAVKLNSADFQRGGFEDSDAVAVVGMLNSLQVDLVEITGGSYESPAMQGQTRDGSTLAREAYFLTFAKDILATARMPLMLTGGIRRRTTAQEVINSGASIVGIATSLALNPNLPHSWARGEISSADLPEVNWRNKTLAALAKTSMIKSQMDRMSNGKNPVLKPSPIWELLTVQVKTALMARKYRKWMSEKTPA